MTLIKTDKTSASWLCVFAGISLFFNAALVKGNSVLDHFSSEQKRQLLSGEAVFEYVEYKDKEKKGLGHGKAYAVINKPIETCYRILTDFSKRAEFYPRLSESKIIKTHENKTWMQETLDFRIKKIENVIIHEMHPEHHRVDYYMDDTYPHDLKDTKGNWYLEKMDNQKTLLTYAVTKADVGFPVPKFILKLLSGRDLPKVVENIKKRIESDGKWTKEDH